MFKFSTMIIRFLISFGLRSMALPLFNQSMADYRVINGISTKNNSTTTPGMGLIINNFNDHYFVRSTDSWYIRASRLLGRISTSLVLLSINYGMKLPTTPQTSSFSSDWSMKGTVSLLFLFSHYSKQADVSLDRKMSMVRCYPYWAMRPHWAMHNTAPMRLSTIAILPHLNICVWDKNQYTGT